MKRTLSLTLGLIALSVPAFAGDVVKPADQRFADADAKETPSFQRHVLPLMGRLGCNGRACHGSFQGQGGFRLSLFGYDFKSDHDALLKGDNPRADIEVAEDSLMLQKPTLATPHKGGKRLDVDSWQYHIIKKWIEAGAKPVGDDDPHFVKLEVTPAEIVFKTAGETIQIKVVAHWSDGTVEDVTPLCRFRTNDESIAEIDVNGLVKSLGKGDTAVVAFYDNGVVPTQVMLPVSDKVGKKYPKVPTPTKIDELVVEKLRKLGMVPSGLAGDAEFLRRVSLDITGSLPTPDEITAFLDDKSSDKRAKKIDELLERPAYAAWWATIFCDITGNNPQQIQLQAIGNFGQNGPVGTQWWSWIHKRVKENTPYNELVRGIVLAVSRKPGQDYDAYAADMGAYFVPTNNERFKDYAEHDYMPYFWLRRSLRNNSEEMALAFSHTFLGVRLTCSQCHKHPFDQWTQQDFKQFSAFFDRVRYQRDPDAAKRMAELESEAGVKDLKDNRERQQRAQQLLNEGKLLPWQELLVTKANNNAGRGQPNRKQGPAGRTITPKLLGGDEVVGQLDDPRQAVLQWMLDKDNPYFAKSIVNRVWAQYFGVGIVEAPDDMNLANPPTNPALLDWLANAFVEHSYDLKWLHREIANSRTYQLTWRPNDTNQYDTRNFSHAYVRRLPAEVTYDSIVLATAGAERLKELHADPTGRAITDLRSGRGNANRGNPNDVARALKIFGQPDRATACDCERSMEPSLSQSLFLMNDNELFRIMDLPNGRLQELSRQVAAATKPEREKENPKGDPKRPGNMAQRIKEIERRIDQLEKDGKSEEATRVRGKLAAIQADVKGLEEKAKPDPEPEKPAPAATASLNTDELVREMYLRTLSRFPTDSEMSRSREYVAAAKDQVTGVRDVLWALLNTKEFIVNH